MSDLLEQARERSWYHTLELPGYTTPGIFDLRPYVDRYRLPERLDGLRVLEVGTWDGFWSFELERRGAAEVVAIDLDDEADLDFPPRRVQDTLATGRGDGFRLAKEILGSAVERVDCSVYHATPERLEGQFDLVFIGSVLVHLRDQLLALSRLAALTKPGGRLVMAEGYDRMSSLLPFPTARYFADRESSVVFWLPAKRTWKRLVWTAGYDAVESVGTFNMKATAGYGVPHVVIHATR